MNPPSRPVFSLFSPIPGSLTLEIPGLLQDPTMCLRCRSAQLLCGKPACPLLLRYQGVLHTLRLTPGLAWDGSTPPGLFVGRMGYPYVQIGPLLTPEHGSTEIYDTPERWVGRSVPEIVGFRTSLVRGMAPARITDAEVSSPLVDHLQLLALSSESADTEAVFRKPPRVRLELSDETPPYGPSAPLEMFRPDVRRVDPHLERAAGDIHATAREVVAELYVREVPVSRIQRAFSAGVLGRRGHRRFVPTRWSITAVDDLLSKENLERIRTYPEINGWELYTLEALGNRWFVLLFPSSWCYESIESWSPGTLWNPTRSQVLMIGDHEGWNGRSQYARMGGCYYAARLAVTEKLLRRQHQAGALVLREVHPGEILPLGVWNVREHVRAALRQSPRKLADWSQVAAEIAAYFQIPARRWLRESHLLQNALFQHRLEDFDADPAR